FVERAARYASERMVFGRPIGANQGVQFPIAQAYGHVEAADLVRYKAAWLFDRGKPCGAEANLAKLLASEASWEAANACLTVHGATGWRPSTTWSGSSARRACTRWRRSTTTWCWPTWASTCSACRAATRRRAIPSPAGRGRG